MDVVLVAPEIATNTGNIIRLSANTGCRLHLVDPLGFSLDDRRLRRAGLDYGELADVHCHPDLATVLGSLPGRAFAFSSRGSVAYHQVGYRPDDVFVFGAERSGLGADDLERFPPDRVLRLPMRPHNRSLNLANAVAVVIYEAWRQLGFDGAGDPAGPSLTSEEPGGHAFDL